MKVADLQSLVADSFVGVINPYGNYAAQSLKLCMERRVQSSRLRELASRRLFEADPEVIVMVSHWLWHLQLEIGDMPSELRTAVTSDVDRYRVPTYRSRRGRNTTSRTGVTDAGTIDTLLALFRNTQIHMHY